MMNNQLQPRARSIHRLCCVLAVVLLSLASCSNSKDNSAQSDEKIFAQIKSQADPVAEVTAGVAVAKLSNYVDPGVDATVKEMRTAHASTVQQLKDSLCKTMQDAGKKASGDRADKLRAIA